ncbi:SSI family serine proteinase inhibitor [Streptomyces sp. NPDC004647]|uniref:SSI family serine proteinase inhibitor n=1 Tax=Streptomyces sp. NPDC004647 TaxID=3154671 RepID=UPI0033BBB4E7
MLLRRLAVTAFSLAAAFAALPATGAGALQMPLPMPAPAADTEPVPDDVMPRDTLTPRDLITPSDEFPPPAVLVPPAGEDRLTITVTDSGNRSFDGSYRLDCHPAGGTHAHARSACDRLDELTRWGEDPFAPVAPRSNCTMIHGGPATAHVTGSWAGRPVDARFDRKNGCEINRWNNLRPVLPDTTS